MRSSSRGISLSPELRQYLETILWAENDESTSSGGVPLDDNYTVHDFSEESIIKAEKELEDFIARADEAVLVQEDHEEETGELESRDFTVEDLASDFWYTRNGHGVGFWDRPEKYGERLAAKLTALSKEFGEVWSTVGDDGKIYLS